MAPGVFGSCLSGCLHFLHGSSEKKQHESTCSTASSVSLRSRTSLGSTGVAARLSERSFVSSSSRRSSSRRRFQDEYELLSSCGNGYFLVRPRGAAGAVVAVRMVATAQFQRAQLEAALRGSKILR